MGRNRWLSSLGLLIEPAFLTGTDASAIRARMLERPGMPATVYSADGAAHIKELTRRTSTVDIGDELDLAVRAKLNNIQPRLTRHFGEPLADACEPPNYLRYDEGDYFRPHVDSGRPGAGAPQPDRRISVVVFLNADYDGGELRFFNLLEGDAWRDVGVACEPSEGLLIAFRADLLHDVTPVTRGTRCTIATWFARSAPGVRAPQIGSGGSSDKDPRLSKRHPA